MNSVIQHAPFLSAILLGLAGSLHCIGMCGPLAAAIPGGCKDRRNPHLGRIYYHVGRACTYALLGLFAGSLGMAFYTSGIQQVVSISLGIALIAGWLCRQYLTGLPPVRYLIKKLQRITAIFLKQPHPESLLIAGMLNGLLPCGLVYTAMVAASLFGTPVKAALYMFIFGLGTIPALYAISAAGHTLRSPGTRIHWSRATTALTLIAGILLVVRGLALGIPYLSPSLPAQPGEAPACCPHETVGEESP